MAEDESMAEPAFDRETALERLGDDLELLQELAETFFEDYLELLLEVRTAVAAGNAGELLAAAHTLKGCVSNFEARPAYEAALRLETIGRSGDLSEAESGLETLEDAVHALAGALKSLGHQEVE